MLGTKTNQLSTPILKNDTTIDKGDLKMAESKFLKAYCEKADQYFGLEIKKFGSSWKAVTPLA